MPTAVGPKIASSLAYVIPSVIVLVLLAVPPILTNAYIGVRDVDPEVREAARGMGMTGLQLLRKVELPLALPLAAIVSLLVATPAVAPAATAEPTGGVEPSVPVLVVGDSLAVGMVPFLEKMMPGARLTFDVRSGRTTPQGLVALRARLLSGSN